MANTKVLTQAVDESAYKEFDELYDKLVKYANAKGIRKPKKGEVLSKLIRDGIKDNPPLKYFK